MGMPCIVCVSASLGVPGSALGSWMEKGRNVVFGLFSFEGRRRAGTLGQSRSSQSKYTVAGDHA